VKPALSMPGSAALGGSEALPVPQAIYFVPGNDLGTYTLDVSTQPVPGRPRTHLQDNIVKPKVFTDGTIIYDRLGLISTCELQTLHEALGDERWKSPWMRNS
jgi:hypothetical protein